MLSDCTRIGKRSGRSGLDLNILSFLPASPSYLYGHRNTSGSSATAISCQLKEHCQRKKFNGHEQFDPAFQQPTDLGFCLLQQPLLQFQHVDLRGFAN